MITTEERQSTQSSLLLARLLREEKMNRDKQSKASYLLSSNSGEKPEKKESKDKRTPGGKIASLWCRKYNLLGIGKYGPVAVKEKTLLRRLVDEYGEDRVRATALYYLENFREIRTIRGYPTISALYGFRSLLFQALDEKRGQYDLGDAETDYVAQWKAREGIE